MEQWPDITGNESVWNSTAPPQAKLSAAAVSAQKQALSPGEVTMEQLRQEQARRMVMATSERAAEEERRAKEMEEKQRLQQQRELEERKRKQEEER